MCSMGEMDFPDFPKMLPRIEYKIMTKMRTARIAINPNPFSPCLTGFNIAYSFGWHVRNDSFSVSKRAELL